MRRVLVLIKNFSVWSLWLFLALNPLCLRIKLCLGAPRPILFIAVRRWSRQDCPSPLSPCISQAMLGNKQPPESWWFITTKAHFSLMPHVECWSAGNSSPHSQSWNQPNGGSSTLQCCHLRAMEKKILESLSLAIKWLDLEIIPVMSLRTHMTTLISRRNAYWYTRYWLPSLPCLTAPLPADTS